MQNNDIASKDKFLNILRILSLIVIATMIILCLIYFRNATVEDIITYKPDDYFLSILAMLLLYSLKSLSIVFPLKILFASCGVMYPLWVAIIVNYLGLVCTLSIPFFWGRFLGKDYVDKLVEKYPKIKQFNNITSTNGFILTLLIKSILILPCDITSMFLGASKVKYHEYIIAGLIALTPDMIAVTVLGENLESNHIYVYIALAVDIILTILSIVLLGIFTKKHGAINKD